MPRGASGGQRGGGRGPRKGGGGPRRGQPRHGGSRPRRGQGRQGDAEQPAPRHEPEAYRPPPPEPRPSELIPTDRTFQGLNLYPFQVAAIDAIEAGHSVLVSAPTGAGKTLVADYAVETAFKRGWRVVYTAPIKALSNQKYRDYRALHGDQVGIMTGDVTIHPDADLLIMTTEVFRNTLFDEPERLSEFRFVIHDEVHYLDDPDRGTVWEESIIHAPPEMRIVGLSATVPNVRELAAWMESVRGEDVTVVEMIQRPVPLDHLTWVPDLGPVRLKDALGVLRRPFHERRDMRRERSPSRMIDWLEREKLLPALCFAFSRKECERLAVENQRRRLLTDDESSRVLSIFDGLTDRFDCPRTPAIARLRALAAAGVGYHHAGMLPVHKEIVERLFTSGLVRVLFATETFALGINMPARAVAFAMLRKFNGEKMDYMRCRDYGQMAGRAGRQGMDDHGLVISMVDPRMDKPHGVQRVLSGKPEPVVSRWNPDYGTLLSQYRHMGERVLETYQRSFARFQRLQHVSENKRDRTSMEERLLAARLRILKRAGYVEDGQVTDRGQFAARVNGYEIQAAEWREAGLLADLDEIHLAALLLATVYEPRREHGSEPVRDKRIGTLVTETLRLLTPFRTAEWEESIGEMTPLPDFGLTSVLYRWLDGRPLTDMEEITSVGEGDVVRSFRLMIQLCRQIRKALPADEKDVRARINRVMDRVNRDEVDARRQLELGGEEDAASGRDSLEDLVEADGADRAEKTEPSEPTWGPSAVRAAPPSDTTRSDARPSDEPSADGRGADKRSDDERSERERSDDDVTAGDPSSRTDPASSDEDDGFGAGIPGLDADGN